MRTLIDTVRPLSQAPRTPEEIEAGTVALRPEGAVPADLLHQVLAGDNEPAQDLTSVQLRTLAEFFMLTPAYFLGSDAEIENIDAELEYLCLVRDPATVGVPYLCTRSGPVNAAMLRTHSRLMRELPAILADPEAHGAVTFHPNASRRSAEPPAHPAPDAQD